MKAPRYQIHVCDGPSCGVTHESERLVERLEAKIEDDPELADRVWVNNYCCFGRCEDGPNLFVEELPEGVDPGGEPEPEVLETVKGFYPGMDEDKVLRVLDEHCKKHRPVEDLVDDY